MNKQNKKTDIQMNRIIIKLIAKEIDRQADRLNQVLNY